jgi:hypothetical protein
MIGWHEEPIINGIGLKATSIFDPSCLSPVSADIGANNDRPRKAEWPLNEEKERNIDLIYPLPTKAQ